MTHEDNGLVQTLRRLTLLEPDQVRSERVRVRCRDAIAQPLPEGRRPTASGRFTAPILDSGLTYALSVGYLSALVHELLRVYLRR
jgi:hypothetical protein